MTAPTKAAPLLTALERGNTQFPRSFRAFSSQFTQTELMKLATEYLGTKAIHSSTIGGFRDGRLMEPSPKSLMALGYVNLAIARCFGHPEDLIDPEPMVSYPPTLPHHMKSIWENKMPMVDAKGVALGPSGMFEAFTGLRDLSSDEKRHLPEEDATEASAVLGRYLRSHFAKHDIDWYANLKQLAYDCPTIEPLLLNKPVPGDRLLCDLDKLGDMLGLSGDVLWENIHQNLGR